MCTLPLKVVSVAQSSKVSSWLLPSGGSVEYLAVSNTIGNLRMGERCSVTNALSTDSTGRW